MNAVQNPCKDCDKRVLYCHNEQTCEEWRKYREYVEWRNEQARLYKATNATSGKYQ